MRLQAGAERTPFTRRRGAERPGTGLKSGGAGFPSTASVVESRNGVPAHRRGVYIMRVVLDNAWPGIIDACEAALRAVR
ncbi:hypothetical protein ABZ944_40260, partial [Streptomyces flaveolus]